MKEVIEKICRFVPNKLYLQLMYFKHFNKFINFKNPVTLNEKIQWLKLNEKNSLYTTVVDKYAVREYIAKTIGEQYLIPLLGVWDSVDEIKYDELPNQFVLKCNHDSHSVFICKDKKEFDFDEVKKKLNKKLKKNGYWYGREWAYKDIKPKIIAEKYIDDGSEGGIKDYKIMCMNGEPNNIGVYYNRQKGHVENKLFDLNWNWLPYNRGDDKLDSNFTMEKPTTLNEMIEIAKILSKEYYFCRVDLYDVYGKVYFGEITLYPASGLDKDITKETDLLLGEQLSIPVKL